MPPVTVIEGNQNALRPAPTRRGRQLENDAAAGTGTIPVFVATVQRRAVKIPDRVENHARQRIGPASSAEVTYRRLLPGTPVPPNQLVPPPAAVSPSVIRSAVKIARLIEGHAAIRLVD